ncbi:hypothetical protein ACJX0J_025544, partial [Zea mays]
HNILREDKNDIFKRDVSTYAFHIHINLIMLALHALAKRYLEDIIAHRQFSTVWFALHFCYFLVKDLNCINIRAEKL